jgi:glycosyltransferase involved in cell wall biosynthesis
MEIWSVTLITSRKKILILMHNYATQFIDIANQYVKAFDPKNYCVMVAYLSGTPNEAVKVKTLAEKVVFLDCSKRNIRGIKISPIRKLIRLQDQEKFSLVICHRYKPIYVMLWVAQFRRIPGLIFTMHAMKTLDFLSRRLLIALLARKNMYFAGVSTAVRDDLRRHIWRVPSNRVITLYNCIDVSASEAQLLSRRQARQFFNLPEDALVFGTIGRIAPEKDQKNLIRSFIEVKKQLPDAKLMIIGDGPPEAELRELTSKMRFAKDVYFPGFIPGAMRYLKALDVFILCSVKEAFGRVLLEAMVAKVPVIGTLTNGIPEVIGKAGMLVGAGDSMALAKAMTSLGIQTPEVRVVENFSTLRFSEEFWRVPIVIDVLEPALPQPSPQAG